jgi:hypothetical protein
MPTDEHVSRILSAGNMNWFEADKVTLAEIKVKYLLDAEAFLYFRKGEDWLKYLVDCLLSLGLGPEQIMDDLRELNFWTCLDWYIRIAGGVERARKHIIFLKNKIWEPFT